MTTPQTTVNDALMTQADSLWAGLRPVVDIFTDEAEVDKAGWDLSDDTDPEPWAYLMLEFPSIAMIQATFGDAVPVEDKSGLFIVTVGTPVGIGTKLNDQILVDAMSMYTGKTLGGAKLGVPVGTEWIGHNLSSTHALQQARYQWRLVD